MIVNLDLKFDADVASMLELDPAHYIKSFNIAVNKVAHKTIVAMGDAIEQKWNLNIKETSPNYFITQSVLDGTSNTRGGTMRFLPLRLNLSKGEATITFKGAPINLSRFVTQWSPSSVQVRSLKTGKSFMRKSEPRVQIERSKPSIQVGKSFVATMRSGHKGVFQRDRIGAKSKVLELRTITLPSMLAQVGFDKHLQERWDKDFSNAFDMAFAKK